jgi:hypothetical protein
MDFPTFKPLQFTLLLSLAAALLVTLFVPRPTTARAAVADQSRPRPVLVELFTSEGCSSCPPADALLARLDAQQGIAGARVIVLSEHVTYWDRLGWRDPFSLDAVTARQQQYADRFGLDSVYTPQAVVDGASQVTGSDGPALKRAIEREADTPAADLAIQDATWSSGTVHFKVRTISLASDATVTAALADDSAQSSVARGENAGRTLRHVAVVRAIRDMGKTALDGGELALKLPGESNVGKGTPLRLVVFLTDRRTAQVLGVAEQTIPRQP